MEFRTEKRVIALITGLLLSPALFAQQSFQYEAWHRALTPTAHQEGRRSRDPDDQRYRRIV